MDRGRPASGRLVTLPFECFLDPFSGKVETLYVQGPESLCRLVNANATWKRTPIRNATSLWVRIADLPYCCIPIERRGDRSKFTAGDRMSVVAMWPVASLVFLLSWPLLLFVGEDAPGKSETMYLPLPYMGLRYPRLARSRLENRSEILQQLPSSAATSEYRTFRPRFLNYFVAHTGPDGEQMLYFERRPVGPGAMPPFVVVAYCSRHYARQVATANGGPPQPEGENLDTEALLATAFSATQEYFQTHLPQAAWNDLENHPRAFWSAVNCIPPHEAVDQHGNIVHVPDGPDKEALKNRDTYNISDIIRAAEHVIVVVGNITQPWNDNALSEWGMRIWTIPEILLSKGDSVTVWHCGMREGHERLYEVTEIPKSRFPALAWNDAKTSRQLIENYSSVHLTPLELVKIMLECLMNRDFNLKHPGDRSYVLMGLLRIRPPIDKSDSAFQAFARLSLPQDGNKLMERLICLLPNDPDESWELMTDQYQASLWDIYPDTQVCGIGENDTIILDGAKGAQIQWSKFTTVRSLQRLTFKRFCFFCILLFSPILFLVGVIMVGTSSASWQSLTAIYEYYSSRQPDLTTDPVFNAGLAIMLLSLLLFIIPAPWYLGRLFAGKMRAVEPCFFGLEGYVPLEIIEELLFGRHGKKDRRLRWSAWGSPQSRHTEGAPQFERVVCYKPVGAPAGTAPPASNHQRQQRRQEPEESYSTTYPVEALDPTTPCPECRATGSPYCRHHPTVAKLQDMSRAELGALKPFTLVDTHNMTVTLFFAARPPTALVVAGSEGGMKRAIACSLDVASGALCRETVLRIPTRSVDCMETLPRVRLGLRRDLVTGGVMTAGDGRQ